MNKILPFVLFSLLISTNCVAQRGRRVDISHKRHNVDDEAPDYNNLYYWAAHPAKHDPSDSVPAFLKNELQDTTADVFFIHPTTFVKGILGNKWNADINDDDLNAETDQKTILYQASIFNGSCRVYAPRYRQAHLKTFFLKNDDHAMFALKLAYYDVKTAFDYYMAHYNHGRPIIIAAHSQGSFHAIRLLKEYFDGTPLQKQLVCAYIVGWPIKKEDFVSIPFGENAKQAGCVVGWRSYRTGTIDNLVEKEKGNSLCINPITWTTSETPSSKSEHKGMVGKDFNTLHAKVISTTVEPKTHMLWVDLPPELDESHGFMNNYHIADFNLFYMDVRENVKQRIHTFIHP